MRISTVYKIKRNLIRGGVAICVLLCIVIVILSVMIKSMLRKYGDETIDIFKLERELNDKSNALDAAIAELREKDKEIVFLKKEGYYNNTTYWIIGYYYGHGNTKSYSEINKIVKCSDFVSQEYFDKRLIRKLASARPELMYKILGWCRKETNFTINAIYKNKDGTVDNGVVQVNNRHKNIFNDLKGMGIWSESENKWMFDIETCMEARVFIDDSRLVDKLDKPGTYHGDLYFVKGLAQIDGWQALY